MLDGTVFRTPITVAGIEPCVRNWVKPITIARHAYGDVYKNTELRVPGPGTVELVYTAADGSETRELVQKFDGPGIAQGMHNLDASIESFARSCFEYALDIKQDIWFATKDTISKKYDHRFKDIFQEIYDAEYASRFEEAGIEYFYTLIDDAVARVMKADGGFIWACKNYDGDVMSDMVSSAFGSLAMMTSVLVSPQATTSTRPRTAPCSATTTSTSRARRPPRTRWPPSSRGRVRCASAASWTAWTTSWRSPTSWSAPRSTPSRPARMTGDLALITTLPNPKKLSTRDFILAIAKRLEA